jgi:hypothetical protein
MSKATDDFLRRAATIPETPKETPSQEADRIYAEQHPMKPAPSPAGRMDDERFRLADASDPACPMHTELWEEARRARAEEARLDADIERSAESRNRLIDEYEAALKKAEDASCEVQAMYARLWTDSGNVRERADAAEAALKKAEEEIERLRKRYREECNCVELEEQGDAAAERAGKYLALSVSMEQQRDTAEEERDASRRMAEIRERTLEDARAERNAAEARVETLTEENERLRRGAK